MSVKWGGFSVWHYCINFCKQAALLLKELYFDHLPLVSALHLYASDPGTTFMKLAEQCPS